MSNWILNLFKESAKDGEVGASMPAKDPMDFTLTSNSRGWKTDLECCPYCRKNLNRDEWYAKICNGCGSSWVWFTDVLSRAKRQIWNGEKWVWQYRYSRSNEIEIRDHQYR